MKTSSLLTIVAAVGFAAVAHANNVTITFQENGSNLDLGPTSTFTDSGASIMASGFSGPNTPVDLYAKSDGPGEIGLGLVNDPSGEHEINPGSFVQLTLPPGPPGTTLTTILTGSVQSGEIVHLWWTSTAGTLAGATSIGSATGVDMSFPISATSGFIDITSDSGNILLGSAVISIPNVPDGGMTITLLGGALTALGLARRKLML